MRRTSLPTSCAVRCRLFNPLTFLLNIPPILPNLIQNWGPKLGSESTFRESVLSPPFLQRHQTIGVRLAPCSPPHVASFPDSRAMSAARRGSLRDLAMHSLGPFYEPHQTHRLRSQADFNQERRCSTHDDLRFRGNGSVGYVASIPTVEILVEPPKTQHAQGCPSIRARAPRARRQGREEICSWQAGAG